MWQMDCRCLLAWHFQIRPKPWKISQASSEICASGQISQSTCIPSHLNTTGKFSHMVTENRGCLHGCLAGALFTRGYSPSLSILTEGACSTQGHSVIVPF